MKQKISSQPDGLVVLLYTEVWELFGRFGITSLLVLYMTKTLHLADSTAFYAYASFIAMTYVTPLVGGYLGDRFLGHKRAVLLGSAVMMVGNVLMVIPSLTMLYVGLGVVSVGSGLFTPTLTAMLGRMFKDRDKGRDAAFVFYYLCKNVGALTAPIFCGLVGHYYGYNYAFILSALGMFSGFIVFYVGSERFSAIDSMYSEGFESSLRSSGLSKLFPYLSIVVLLPLSCFILRSQFDGYFLALGAVLAFAVVLKLFLVGDSSAKRNLLYIMLATAVAIIFSSMLGQGGTTLNLFIDRVVDRNILGFEIPTSVFYTLDPLFMVLLSPMVLVLVGKIKKPNFYAAAVVKYAIGLLVLGAGFAVFVGASHSAMGIGKVSYVYVVVAYALFPVAELFIMPIATSMVTRLASEGFEAIMVAIFSLGIASASYFTGMISKLGEVTFKIDSLDHVRKSAFVYSYDFSVTVFILIFSGVLLLVMLLTFSQFQKFAYFFKKKQGAINTTIPPTISNS